MKKNFERNTHSIISHLGVTQLVENGGKVVCVYSKMSVSFLPVCHVTRDSIGRSMFYYHPEESICLSYCHRLGGRRLHHGSSFINRRPLHSFPEIHREQVDGELLRCKV